MAARSSDLPGVTTANMIEHLTAGYQEAIARNDPTTGEKPEAVRIVMRKAVKRTWDQLARERLKDAKPTIVQTDDPDMTFAHVSNFLECCRTRKQPNSTIELGHKVITAAHLANMSYRTGRRIQWDPKKQEVIAASK